MFARGVVLNKKNRGSGSVRGVERWDEMMLPSFARFWRGTPGRRGDNWSSHFSEVPVLTQNGASEVSLNPSLLGIKSSVFEDAGYECEVRIEKFDVVDSISHFNIKSPLVLGVYSL